MYMKTNTFSKLVLAVAGCELAGMIGSVFTFSAISGWYATLARPALNPPAWVFGPVWTALYALMGISLWLAWNRRNARIFSVQLALNVLWSILFFGLHSPGIALLDIIALWLAIVWTIAAFSRTSRSAAYLLVPYLLWVSFAAYLNYAIWALN